MVHHVSEVVAISRDSVLVTVVLLRDFTGVLINVFKLELVFTSLTMVPNLEREGLRCVVRLKEDFLDSKDMIGGPIVFRVGNLDT